MDWCGNQPPPLPFHFHNSYRRYKQEMGRPIPSTNQFGQSIASLIFIISPNLLPSISQHHPLVGRKWKIQTELESQVGTSITSNQLINQREKGLSIQLNSSSVDNRFNVKKIKVSIKNRRKGRGGEGRGGKWGGGGYLPIRANAMKDELWGRITTTHGPNHFWYIYNASLKVINIAIYKYCPTLTC